MTRDEQEIRALKHLQMEIALEEVEARQSGMASVPGTEPDSEEGLSTLSRQRMWKNIEAQLQPPQKKRSWFLSVGLVGIVAAAAAGVILILPRQENSPPSYRIEFKLTRHLADPAEDAELLPRVSKTDRVQLFLRPEQSIEGVMAWGYFRRAGSSGVVQSLRPLRLPLVQQMGGGFQFAEKTVKLEDLLPVGAEEDPGLAELIFVIGLRGKDPPAIVDLEQALERGQTLAGCQISRQKVHLR